MPCEKLDGKNSEWPPVDVHDRFNFVAIMEDTFKMIDKDGSGALSRKELTAFAKDCKQREEDREVAKVLSAHFDDVKNLAIVGDNSDQKFKRQGKFAEQKEMYKSLFQNDPSRDAISYKDTRTLAWMLQHSSSYIREELKVNRKEYDQDVAAKGDPAFQTDTGTIIREVLSRREMLRSWNYFEGALSQK
jgi:hypothetical protein